MRTYSPRKFRPFFWALKALLRGLAVSVASLVVDRDCSLAHYLACRPASAGLVQRTRTRITGHIQGHE